jgi:hypothetical protein
MVAARHTAIFAAFEADGSQPEANAEATGEKPRKAHKNNLRVFGLCAAIRCA